MNIKKRKKKYYEKNDDLNEPISDVINEKINKNRRCDRFSKMTFEHIEKYLVVEILIGIIKLPDVDDYWGKNHLLSNSISEIITENSYKNINSFIHPKQLIQKIKKKLLIL